MSFSFLNGSCRFERCDIFYHQFSLTDNKEMHEYFLPCFMET